MRAAPVNDTTSRAFKLGRLYSGFSLLVVSPRVPNINTVEIPAPTAASVNATSTASITVNSAAARRLKMPNNMTAANRLRSLITAMATATRKIKRTISRGKKLLNLSMN